MSRETVLRIIVYPKPKPRLSELPIDMSQFKKRKEGHVESVVSYVNEEEYLTIQVYEDTNAVKGLYYGPAAKDRHLRCP